MDAGVFSFTTPNLGDEMQSYAVLGHLSRVTQFLNRDNLARYAGPPVQCVFNSFFFLGNGFGHRWPRIRALTRPPSVNIQPIWYGFHANREELLQGSWLDYLRRQGPIGCRDTYTVARLEAAGIPAYFSGCLTLFLSRVFPQPKGERQGIYFIDLSPEAESRIPAKIARRAIRLTTFPPAGTGALERWSMLAELIGKLASAELVVTRRLHAALPCVGFGTPLVVMPNTNFAGVRNRMSGYENIMTLAFPEDAERVLAAIDWSNPPRGTIPPELEQRYEAFRRQLEARGISGPPLDTQSPLDRIASDRIRIRNTLDRAAAAGGETPLGSLRLRLGERSFPVPVKFWTDSYLDIGLESFPGLSRLDLQVEATVSPRSSRWVPCGALRDLVLDA